MSLVRTRVLTKLFAPNREARQRLSSALIIGGGKLTHYLPAHAIENAYAYQGNRG